MKKLLFILFLSMISLTNVKSLNLDINSKYAYVYNLTEDRVMYEKNSEEEIKVASLTKIMTAIIVIENNDNLDKKITVLDEDLRDMYEYTTAGFKDGDSVTIRDLLYGIILASGSDAVNAAVRVTSLTEEEFVEQMNTKAKELNMTHTYFSNPIGKDLDNYSSVHDMEILMRYCLNNATFKEVISSEKYIVNDLGIQINGPLYTSKSKQGIELNYVRGAKTGYTGLSKHSMISYSEFEDISYIIVTCTADNFKNLLVDTNLLYNYMYDNYIYKKYAINFNILVDNSKDSTYNVKLNTKLYLNKDYNEKLITYKYKGINEITIKNHKNEKLGCVEIYYDNVLIKKLDVVLDKDIVYLKAKKNILFKKIIIISIFIPLLYFFIRYLKIRKKKKIKEMKKEIINKNKFIIETTVNVEEFFNLLNSNEISERNVLEHNFIDRCFNKIDFTNEVELKQLYLTLKPYKDNFSNDSLVYLKKLFNYCINNYIKNMDNYDDFLYNRIIMIDRKVIK